MNKEAFARRTSRPWRMVALVAATAFLAPFLAPHAHGNAGAGATSTEYQYGVFPHLAPARLEEIYAPMAAHLGHVLGRRVVFRTKTSFEQFAAELSKQTYDVAFVQPFDYVAAHDRHGYLPLVRRGEPLSAQIMVNDDGSVPSLKSLKSKTLALPPPDSAVSVLTKAMLLEAGLNPARDLVLDYTKSHDSCLQRLLTKLVSGCASAAYPVRFFEAKMKVRFRVLARSRTIPHALIVVHRRVAEGDRQKLRQFFLTLQDSERGRELLKRGELKPFVPARDAEYDIVREYAKVSGK